MEIINLFIILIFTGGFLSLVIGGGHLLRIILRLEFLILSVFFCLILSTGRVIDYRIILFYLFIVVCEGRLALGILIGLVKVYGSEAFSFMNLLQC